MDEPQPTSPASTPPTAGAPWAPYVPWVLLGIVGIFLVWYAVQPATFKSIFDREVPAQESTTTDSTLAEETDYSKYERLPYSTQSLEFAATLTPLSVTWHAPRRVSYQVGRTGIEDDLDCGDFNWAEHPINFYDVGVVSGGTYAGDSVIIGILHENEAYAGICGQEMVVWRFVAHAGHLTLIAKSSKPYVYALNLDLVSIDTDSVIPDLMPPPTLSYQGAELELERSWSTYFDYHHGYRFSTFFATTTKKVFVSPVLGQAYIETAPPEEGDIPQNGIIFRLPDDTVAVYALKVPFWDSATHIPTVVWDAGSKKRAEYQPVDLGRCGRENFISVVTTVGRSELTQIGTTNSGPVYGFVDPNNSFLKKLYEDYAPTAQYRGAEGSDSGYATYASFLASRPVFFWYDPLGRLIKFQRMDIMPLGECGKPVIYLYPQATTTVSVTLELKGGFTKSEPAYNDGWQVVATPQGVLTDLASGKTYPYLFWEGRGDSYEMPHNGFVVTQQEVHTFLLEKLALFGLNAQESADFIEFWEPRMQGAPYYFVTFVGTRDMNRIAPLTITPKPDTVIRVLMDYQPLQHPIAVQGFSITPPARRGFTVVEWGGVLR